MKKSKKITCIAPGCKEVPEHTNHRFCMYHYYQLNNVRTVVNVVQTPSVSPSGSPTMTLIQHNKVNSTNCPVCPARRGTPCLLDSGKVRTKSTTGNILLHAERNLLKTT